MTLNTASKSIGFVGRTLQIQNMLFPFILRLVPNKMKVGNKVDSDCTLIPAIIKVQSNKEVL
jgi:hypothetical protein